MKLIFSKFNKIKHKVALEDESGLKFTYGEIINFSKKIQKNRIKKSIILIISDNTIASISGYAAFMMSDNIIILIDKNFKIDFIRKTIKKFKVDFIFAPYFFFNKLKGLKNKNIDLNEYSLFKTRNKKKTKLNIKNKLLLSTSGTTQSPKFVRLSNDNIFSNTINIIDYLKIKKTHVAITTMPMAYSYGLSIINTHLESGAKIIASKTTIFEKKFWFILNDFKVTSFGGVPDFYEMLQKLKFENIKLPYLKYVTQAGGQLTNDSIKYIKKNFLKKLKFYAMYGQTEASPRMSFLPWKKFFSKAKSIGKPLKSCKMELVDENYKKINEINKTGEIIFYGKNVSLGYAKNFYDLKKGNKNKFKLLTGDLAYKDKDDFFYIVGRKSRISKISGIRVDLEQIEKLINDKKNKVKCVSDNKYLKIKTLNTLNQKKIDKIKNKIYNITGIKKNYMFFFKDNFKVNKNIFKNFTNDK